MCFINNLRSFNLKNIELWNGDCLELMKNISNGVVDMVFADLPYGKTHSDWDKIIPIKKLWEEYKRILSPNGLVCLTATEPFSSLLIVSNLEMFKYDIIWNKKHRKGHLNAKKQPLRLHEQVLVFYKNPPVYNPIMRTGKYRLKGGNNAMKGDGVYGKSNSHGEYNDQYYPTSILEISNAKQTDRFHPNQKPEELMDWFIRTYTNIGQTVLDNTMGSGSTGVVAKKLGRNFIGIEKDKKYFDICVKRIEINK